MRHKPEPVQQSTTVGRYACALIDGLLGRYGLCVGNHPEGGFVVRGPCGFSGYVRNPAMCESLAEFERSCEQMRRDYLDHLWNNLQKES